VIGLHPHRQVITFYSFKGGVGRTMTLANIAYRLAFHHGLHVIAVDWDLEAPGLQSFFRVPANTLKKARGLLDYCEAWESSYREQAAELPDPLSYLVPAEPAQKEETKGSLRLLLAGIQDQQYDARLGQFDWKRFYAESAGAGAIEHLRSRLAESADLVLIDSRTGLTDPGGICTIQIPDAVVLMTAPNQQSLDGIERIAQSISTASSEARVGRGTARVFICMSRVPMVEETYQAREWFKTHQSWFKNGLDKGLWRSEDHQQGLETHVIPQRGTYGFGESLVGRAVGTLEREPLAQAYDKLTRRLLQWKWESVWSGSPISETDLSAKLTQTNKDVTRARKRQHTVDLVTALTKRAQALRQANKLHEALIATEEAVTLIEKLEDPSISAMVYFEHGTTLFELQQYAAARDAGQTSLMNAERIKEPTLIALIRAQLGSTLIMLGQEQEGTQLALQGIADLRTQGKADVAETFLSRLHAAQVIQDQDREIARLKQEAIEFIRMRLRSSRQVGNVTEEAATIRDLLEFATKHRVALRDEAQLRKRLEELEGSAQPAASPAPVKTKRSRAKS